MVNNEIAVHHNLVRPSTSLLLSSRKSSTSLPTDRSCLLLNTTIATSQADLIASRNFTRNSTSKPPSNSPPPSDFFLTEVPTVPKLNLPPTHDLRKTALNISKATDTWIHVSKLPSEPTLNNPLPSARKIFRESVPFNFSNLQHQSARQSKIDWKTVHLSSFPEMLPLIRDVKSKCPEVNESQFDFRLPVLKQSVTSSCTVPDSIFDSPRLRKTSLDHLNQRICQDFVLDLKHKNFKRSIKRDTLRKLLNEGEKVPWNFSTLRDQSKMIDDEFYRSNLKNSVIIERINGLLRRDQNDGPKISKFLIDVVREVKIGIETGNNFSPANIFHLLSKIPISVFSDELSLLIVNSILFSSEPRVGFQETFNFFKNRHIPIPYWVRPEGIQFIELQNL
ncbi:hypothetical protein RCL1_002255 [Eukaryota sp. TZLM3-RCL]